MLFEVLRGVWWMILTSEGWGDLARFPPSVGTTMMSGGGVVKFVHCVWHCNTDKSSENTLAFFLSNLICWSSGLSFFKGSNTLSSCKKYMYKSAQHYQDDKCQGVWGWNTAFLDVGCPDSSCPICIRSIAGDHFPCFLDATKVCVDTWPIYIIR